MIINRWFTFAAAWSTWDWCRFLAPRFALGLGIGAAIDLITRFI